MSGRAVALAVAAALLASSAGACTVQKNSKKPGVSISGPGPEIVVGGLITVAGISLAAKYGTGEDQFNAQQTVTAIGVGIAVLGVVLIGHGIYRLANPPPPAPPVLGLPGAAPPT